MKMNEQFQLQKRFLSNVGPIIIFASIYMITQIAGTTVKETNWFYVK